VLLHKISVEYQADKSHGCDDGKVEDSLNGEDA
jgi:hypothetical protein